jgi:hypothetical protein
MRRVFLATAAAMVLTACSDDALMGPEPGSGDAQLAILNALTLGDQAELRLDGTVMSMPSWGATVSAAIPSGTHRIELRSLITRDLLASADFAVPAGSRRSAVIGGATGKSVVVLVAADTASLPPAGAAKVRLVHTVPKAPTYDAYLTLTGQAADSGSLFVHPFQFGVGQNPQFPGYAVRGPGTYHVILKIPGTGTVALTSPGFAMAAGQVFSVVLAENAAGGLELRVVRER